MSVSTAKVGNRPNRALLSPPSSPEMDSGPPTSRSRPRLQTPTGKAFPPQDGGGQLDHTCFGPEWTDPAGLSSQDIAFAPWNYPNISIPCTADQIDPNAQAISHTDAIMSPETIRPPSFGATSETGLSFDHALQHEYGDVLSPTSVEDEGANTSEGASKTAAERRAEKRKMKRFRLTHNQTRFLMSEYARHAHPDAAQRERLSREIPGLSPRQVQVWFQNRYVPSPSTEDQ
ncbi:MAG: hypothetical protein Q9225_005398 [Loekoesia sp. 1 TL-2023]